MYIPDQTDDVYLDRKCTGMLFHICHNSISNYYAPNVKNSHNKKHTKFLFYMPGKSADM